MFKRSRFLISAVLIAAVFASTMIFSNSAEACPVEPPETLLSLYLKSDLVAIAVIESEKEELQSEDEGYRVLQVERTLKFSSVLKGKAPANFVFARSEYRSKTANDSEPESEIETDIEFNPFGYRGFAKLKVGERYLFFFDKDAETGTYDLTDYATGAKKLNDYDLSVHKKRIRELQSILKKKENQLDALTAWLIRCVEEPSTRWDGVFDLNNSFNALDYDQPNDETAESFVIGEDFHTRTPLIAKNLTDAQKEFLSSLHFSTLRENLFEKGDGFYDGLSPIVSRWDKARLAMYSFSLLQTVDQAEPEKMKTAMTYLAVLLGDEKLGEIADRFPSSDEPEIDQDEVEVTTEKDEAVTTNETSDVAETDTAKQVPQITENNEEAKTEDYKTEYVYDVENKEVKIEVEDKAEATSDVLAQKEKPTLAEIRAKVLRDFTDRYQILVANGFQLIEEKTMAVDK